MPRASKFRPQSEIIRVQLPELHPEQALIKAEAARFNVLNCGRRFGKTTLAVNLIGDEVLVGEPVAYFAPTYRMLAEVWREFVATFRPLIAEKVEDEHYCRLITGGRVDFWSLENENAARGRYYKLVIIDEAAMVSNLLEVWEMVIRPTLVDLRGKAWFMSTPKGRNDFHKLHLFGRDPEMPEWKSWVRTSYDNPHIPASELDSMRGEMSELAFQQEIMAQFLEDSGTVFRNVATTCVLQPSPVESHYKHAMVMGVDWGKQDDFTVLSVMCATCRQEVELIRFNQIDYFLQRQKLQDRAHRWQVQAIECELNSIGMPLFEELQRLGLPVYGFNTTSTSKSPLIESLALAVEQGNIQLLKDPVGVAELEAYERKINPNTGRSTYSAPRGYHDDTVMSRALAFKRMQTTSIQERLRRKSQDWQPPNYAAKGF